MKSIVSDGSEKRQEPRAITPDGLEKLRQELQDLIHVQRRKIADEIARARSFGDLSENAEYHAAKEKQKHLEERIYYLEERVRNAQVIDSSSFTGKRIMFGAYVSLYDVQKDEQLTYHIVGMDEADLEKKQIALGSALARALIGKEEGDEFEFNSARGTKSYVIEKVTY